MIDATASGLRTHFVAVLVGCYAALIALFPSYAAKLLLVAPLILIPGTLWLLAAPARWMTLFLSAALLLPPLPIPLGDSGPNAALLVAAVGVLAGTLRAREWQLKVAPEFAGMLLYFFALLLSIPFAAIYSGGDIAAASLTRVLLFSISIYVFAYQAFGPGEREIASAMNQFRLVYWAAVVSAVFACVDFYFQFPAPAGFGPQFVWLDSGVYRRAQGVFYEASTLGNVCVFFLITVAASLSGRFAEKSLSAVAIVAGLGAFTPALVLSFSRASLANLVLAMTALLFLRRKQIALPRLIALPCLTLAVGAAASYVAFPEVTDFYWQRLSASATYLFSATEGVLSGRLHSWRLLADFLLQHPWHALFGVGYKTLPYSDFIGRPVIADNAYLSALVETGVVGLAALLAFSVAVLRLAYRAARQPDVRVAFLGTCVFCFWIGEMAQMMSGDLLTYWRVLPVYLWVLGIAVRHTAVRHTNDERSPAGPVQ